RQDVLYKWFLTLVKCIHWFNPTIYFVAKKVNLDCEISCDRAVVRGMNDTETKAYAETILALLSNTNSRQIPLTTGMTGKKKALKQRFQMLKSRRAFSRKVTVISMILALVLAISALVVSGVLNGKFDLPKENLLDITTEKRQGDAFNILVTGIDPRGRADAILAFHFDGKTLTGMNIPRNTEYIREGDDTVRTIADYLARENNNQAAIDAVQELFEFSIHYYARVEMEAVEKIVDAIGGLDFDIPYNMVYDDPHQDLHINLTAGRQRLSGEQVVHLLRFRDRSVENDEEIRRMTWFSVMEEILSQGVFGNRIPDVADLYEAVTEHIETNYPVADFIKDLGKLQNSNRNNVVFGTVRGRNLVADGRFVFRINHVASTPLLQVFHAETSAEKLVSTITYTNDVMGFSLKLPEHWKSGYDAVQYHNQVVFYHKEIFEKYGKGSGMLFSITKLDRTQGDRIEELAEPGECLYWSKDVAYYWNIASDVQYPIWIDRDEEDGWMAEQFEDMLEDITFIKNSFSFLEDSPEDTKLKTKQRTEIM
ncbi:MAG: M56 family metallopeptidase/LCP family protein, partial [Clostridia bacterium]|nr:M56 family metallopeptidase/LCP family protein [Clostridia bacterium]